MYGGQPRIPDMSRPSAFKVTMYAAHLCDKLAKVCDMVEANLSVAAGP